METIIKNYDSKLDAKNRITIRGAKYKNYNVRVFENGCIVMEPRVLSLPKTISAKTLKDIDNSVKNFKLGKATETIDLSDFK